jgi:hypothetical protein
MRKGELRLGLSATVASAVLYSAIVLFGVGSASPSAPDAGRDPNASAVLIQGHAETVSGSVPRLPQASPEPRRHRAHTRPRRPRAGVAPAQTSSEPSPVAAPAPRSPRVTESESPSVASSTTVPVAEAPPVVPVPVVAVPVVSVPPLTVPLPELPVTVPEPPVTVPELPATQPLPLP